MLASSEKLSAHAWFCSHFYAEFISAQKSHGGSLAFFCQGFKKAISYFYG
jgi:hypothetical protein